MVLFQWKGSNAKFPSHPSDKEGGVVMGPYI